MIKSIFQGEELSKLGFGTMRLPLLPGGKSSDIDQKQVEDMTAYAIESGINYFDSAYSYHDRQSEIAIGKALRRFPRSSFNLATKYPGHQLGRKGNPERIFEEQLEKCGVSYFDFYLLHNVNEYSFQFYGDRELGIVDYFLRQKQAGRIRHLGFSCHGDPENLRQVLEMYGKELEFCQIQLNYLDWTLQDAKTKCAILKEFEKPIWVMEPIRGGLLARLDETAKAKLCALRPDESAAAMALRWVQTVPEVTMILSGMSSLEQMQDNVRTFSEERPLNEEEIACLYEIAEELAEFIPCTGCRYCCPGCPQQLDIPYLISILNSFRVADSLHLIMRSDALPPDKRPEACLGCGQCAAICPQKINVVEAMKELAGKLASHPTWEEIVKTRLQKQ